VIVIEEKILKMYFVYRMKQIDIARKLNISKYKVCRVVTKDSRYTEEKNARKEINRKKHIEKTKEYIKKKRRMDSELAKVKRDHILAVMELSDKNRVISNRAFRNWNTSIYRYDGKSKSFVLKRNVITGADVPKRVKW